LRILIENKSNINHKDINKRTPLHHVSLCGNSRPIPILCSKGANIKDKDKDGKTALELSTDERIREMITVYGSAKKFDRMVKTVELN
jgi:ankyrin repeat protein